MSTRGGKSSGATRGTTSRAAPTDRATRSTIRAPEGAQTPDQSWRNRGATGTDANEANAPTTSNRDAEASTSNRDANVSNSNPGVEDTSAHIDAAAAYVATTTTSQEVVRPTDGAQAPATVTEPQGSGRGNQTIELSPLSVISSPPDGWTLNKKKPAPEGTDSSMDELLRLVLATNSGQARTNQLVQTIASRVDAIEVLGLKSNTMAVEAERLNRSTYHSVDQLKLRVDRAEEMVHDLNDQLEEESEQSQDSKLIGLEDQRSSLSYEDAVMIDQSTIIKQEMDEDLPYEHDYREKSRFSRGNTRARQISQNERRAQANSFRDPAFTNRRGRRNTLATTTPRGGRTGSQNNQDRGNRPRHNPEPSSEGSNGSGSEHDSEHRRNRGNGSESSRNHQPDRTTITPHRRQDTEQLGNTPAGKSYADGTNDYQQRILEGIRLLIERMIGQSFEYPEDFKGIRAVGPEPYDGDNNIEIFNIWLRGLLRFCQLSKLRGPKYDDIRITTMGQYLIGTAADWFRNAIEDPYNEINATFEQIICQLFRRFVHGSSAQRAAQAYDQVKYKRSEGVQAYHLELEMKARMLIVSPDGYSFKSRFIQGLPDDIHNTLILQEHMTAEHNTIDQLIEVVYRIEEANENILRRRQEKQRTTTRPTMPERQPRTRDQRNSRGWNSRPSNNDRPRATASHQIDKPIDKPRRDNADAAKRPAKDNSNVTCYACNGKGHYSNDIICPEYGKPRKEMPQLRAARAEEPLDTKDKHHTGSDNEDRWDGNDYESQGSDPDESSEDNSDHTLRTIHQRAMRIAESDDEDDEEDVVYLRAARAKAQVTPENPQRISIRNKQDRPNRSKESQACLATWVTINGLDAFTLFDSGSSTDSISPDFARVSNLKAFTLANQVPLQLGCVGSRATINFGCTPNMELGQTKVDKYYFDVVNIDRYDCVLGTVFMRKHQVQLDFAANAIIIDGQRIEALKVEEEAAIVRGRKQFSFPNHTPTNV